MSVKKRQKKTMETTNDKAIEEDLNKSNGDYSGDEDDADYLPPDTVQPEFSESEENSENEQENVVEVQQNVPRRFWSTKQMSLRGPNKLLLLIFIFGVPRS
ncbi:unnamed protein product [Parnassius mnemosyne]|uniref:Uncharacterized protein n=1 Tax=Parnassius mnemosyne TaxID=213953 RepID=A0AAV1LDB7_9NEOP